MHSLSGDMVRCTDERESSHSPTAGPHVQVYPTTIEVRSNNNNLLVTKHTHMSSILDRHCANCSQSRQASTIIRRTRPLQKMIKSQCRLCLLVPLSTLCYLSLSTIKRARQWVVGSPKYCQLIWDANREKHMAWCQKKIREGEHFDDVIFTD